jgi:hypothetical protein
MPGNPDREKNQAFLLSNCEIEKPPARFETQATKAKHALPEKKQQQECVCAVK